MANHPLGDLPLPPFLDRLIERIRADPDDYLEPWERVMHALEPLPDPDSALAAMAFGGDHDPMELHYLGHPFEMIPLFWNGGDALHYGIVWHDAAVVPMAASFAPGDDEAVWLGDDLESGLRNLLAWYAHGQFAETELAEKMASRGEALADALGLDISDLPPLTMGARSERELWPRLPDGWDHEGGPRGVGTVAPSELFGPELPQRDFDEDVWIADARRALDAGFPARALAELREVYFGTTGSPAAAAAMAEAYRALGREPLAARAEAYVALHS